MQYEPLQPADPALAQSHLPPLPPLEGVAALSEAESTKLIGLIDAEPQFGWNNTNIEINLSPISLLLGMIVGCLLTLFFRG
ncbi:MAG: hypothetical protein AAF773_11910 [Cyanobacteria bacterium P01_D01_bin.115]